MSKGFIDNSFKSAIKTGSWKNGGAKAYAEIARLCLTDPEAILKEAYLIGPKCKISIDRGYITPFAKTGLKYPHHSVKNGKLVVNIPGLKAAYSRAKQMGIYKGEVKEHLQRHYKQLGIYDSSQMAVDDKITENFEYIESCIDNEYLQEGYSELNSIDKDLDTTYSEACKDLESAREFVSRVKDLADEYDANFFIVTDGASGIHNNGNPAVKHARDCQIEWEKENGYDPDEDWSQDIKPEDIDTNSSIEESFNDIESMIYESTKSAMSCNNPQELLKYMMANYKPGFVHLTKKVKGMAGTPDVRYPLGNDYQFTAAFNLQPPSRIEVNRVGTSWDFCELEREWFHRHGYQFSVFYVELYNPKKPTQHTFLVYYNQRKYWWFEFGWNEKIGIKAYDDLSLLLTDVMNNIRKFNNDYKNNFIIRWLTNKPKTGITAPEYLKYARNSVIINPKYLPKRLNDEKLFDQVRESYDLLLESIVDEYIAESKKKHHHGGSKKKKVKLIDLSPYKNGKYDDNQNKKLNDKLNKALNGKLVTNETIRSFFKKYNGDVSEDYKSGYIMINKYPVIIFISENNELASIDPREKELRGSIEINGKYVTCSTINVNYEFFKLSPNIQLSIIYHELGHETMQNNWVRDTSNDKGLGNFMKRGSKYINGIHDDPEHELEADAFAANHIGEKNIKKMLKKLYNFRKREIYNQTVKKFSDSIRNNPVRMQSLERNFNKSLNDQNITLDSKRYKEELEKFINSAISRAVITNKDKIWHTVNEYMKKDQWQNENLADIKSRLKAIHDKKLRDASHYGDMDYSFESMYEDMTDMFLSEDYQEEYDILNESIEDPIIYEEDIDLLDESIDYYEEKTSKKEQHRIDKFKQRHGFIPDKNNPNKGTIETDIIGKDGKKMRVPFEITNSRDLGQAASGKVDESDPRYMDIRMSRQMLKRKPAISNTVFKHEEGHLDYKLNPEKYAKMKKDIQDMLSAVSNDLNDHGQNVEEYIADNYAKQHSGYSIKGFDQMINSLRYTNDQIKKDLVTFEKKLLHNSANSIKVVSDLTDEIHKKSMELNMIMIPKLNTNKKSLMEIYNNKEKYKDLTDDEKQTMIKWMIKTIQKTEKTINDYKTSIKNIKSYIDNIKNQLKDQNKEELNNRKDMALQGLNQAKKENENEMNLRHQFAHNYESYEEDLSFLDNDIFTERWNELEKNHIITEAEEEEKKEDQKEEENKEEDILDKPVQEDPPSIEDADSEDNNEEDSIPKDNNMLDEPIEDDIDKQEAEAEEILSDEKPDEELNNEEDIPEETPVDNKPMSMPKKTDAAEEDKNGKRRKKLYIEFINWCKEFNDKNSFGSVFDQDVFHNTYPFVPDEMRYFYRISNPLVCVLSGDLTFFSLCELRKLNANNSQMNKYLIFAATEKDYRIFNMEDRQVYLATDNNGTINLQQSLGDTFDTYLQNMINHGDILNGPIPETYGNEKKEDTKEETIKEESVNIFEDFLFNN